MVVIQYCASQRCHQNAGKGIAIRISNADGTTYVAGDTQVAVRQVKWNPYAKLGWIYPV